MKSDYFIAKSFYSSELQNLETELPMIDGIDWKYGLLHLPQQELLLETTMDFYKSMDMEAEKLEAFYTAIQKEETDFTEYRIKVHSMKSTANMIGCTVLGGMAKVLENAAREENKERIEALHAIFISEWFEYKEKLKEVLPIPVQREARKELLEEDKAEVLQLLRKLQSAMEEVDIDTMDALMEQLKVYQYAKAAEEAMERLAVCVINLDTAGAKQEIEKIKNQIAIK